jgi:hypothetical protein
MSLTSLLISPFLMVNEVQIDFAEKKFKLLAAKKYLTCKLLILYMKRVLINNWFPPEPRLYWHILDGWIFLDLLYQSRILLQPINVSSDIITLAHHYLPVDETWVWTRHVSLSTNDLHHTRQDDLFVRNKKEGTFLSSSDDTVGTVPQLSGKNGGRFASIPSTMGGAASTPDPT